MDNTMNHNCETMGFEEWMQAVDNACWNIAQVSVYDLADACYRDMYDNGESAEDAASTALYDEGFYEFMGMED